MLTSVNLNEMKPQSVLKIRQGMELPAMETAKKNGADDIFVKMGNDTYAVSGTGFHVKDLHLGDKVTLNGQQAEITFIDDQINSAMDGLKSVGKAAALAAGTGGVAVGGGLL